MGDVSNVVFCNGAVARESGEVLIYYGSSDTRVHVATSWTGLDGATAGLRQEHVNAAWALRTVAERLQAQFDEFSDSYLKERRTDLDDVLGRIQVNLAGAPGAPSLSRLPRPHVLVADEIAPSEAAELDWENVLAVITDAGDKDDIHPAK